MHAGIINAGGILLIRMSPLVALSGTAMTILALAGGFTAVFASVVMLTQASIKRYLAFSTVAQMGFMMLECGLGAFHLALVHLVAHSMYKAYAFLSTGGAVKEPSFASRQSVATSVPGFIAALAAAVAMVFGAASALGRDATDSLGIHLMLAIALAQLLRNFSTGTVAASIAACAAYFGLESIAAKVVTPAHSEAQWVGVLYAVVFAGLSVVQAAGAQLARTPLAQQIYVMARNGFYINTVANRLTAWLWPQTASREAIS
jgi:NAD(P)H-quinone oxidoreductase subunit 5